MFRLEVPQISFKKEVNCNNLAFSQGLGVFETIRLAPRNFASEIEFSNGDNSTYRENANLLVEPQYLKEHLCRLNQGIATLFPEVSYLSINELTKAVELFLQMQKPLRGALKIVFALETFTKGYYLFKVEERYYDAALYKTGVKVKISDQTRCSLNGLNAYKTLSNMSNMLELHATRNAGFFEAVMLNEQGFIAEGCISNIFWQKGRIIYTPAIACGILPGVMRNKVIVQMQGLGFKVEEGKYLLTDLFTASKVFLTNSLMQILPVSTIDFGTKLANSESMQSKMYEV